MKIKADTVRRQAKELLLDWCDGLLRYRVDWPDRPEFDGGLLCPACKVIHGRCWEAVYPLLCAAEVTKEEKYLTAARRLFRWSGCLLCDDGSLYNDANSSWNGTTVFAAIALHDALYYHGHLLTDEERGEWEARLRGMGEWLFVHLTPGTAYLNYYAANACALELLGQYFHRQEYFSLARKLAMYCFAHLGQCGLLIGEGRPHNARSPKGCAAVDVGYNAEETLPCLLRYAEAAQNTLGVQTCRALFRNQLQWMLPDGAWDNSLGTRAFKWTYWGSRTTDGCEDALLRLGREEPIYTEAALRRLTLLREYTHNGLLTGGRDLPAMGEPTCLHHSFCRAKTMAAILNGPVEDADRTEIPAETADGIVFYPELAAYRLNRGGWIADISANDFHTRGGGHASGGALSLLWHQSCGPIVAVGMVDYAVNEPFNQQQTAKKAAHRSPCPRVETEADGKRWGQHYDYGADMTGEEKDGALRVHADAYLCDENHVRKEAAGFCTLDYELTEEALTVRGRVSPSLAESAAYLLPVISEKTVITAARGTIDENAPVGFNLNPGFRFTEYRVRPDRTGCFEVRIAPRGE